ncbi:MAG TPA: RNA polymerase sigma factor [Phycisphaerae bacterium]|nr:RNA polymerase sigma factor [Phycisphaerae bacterium]
MADREQFESAALPHIEAVFRAAVALCGDREHAEDLVQVTYLKALEGFNSFRPGSNCRAWLVRILRNTWVDELRHRKVAGPQLPVNEGLLGAPDSPDETVWTNARDLLDNFSDQQVIRALGEIPEEQRLTLFLVDVEQLPQEEVAEIMAVAVGTVKSRTSRARAALKQRLFAHAKDLGFIGRG